MADTPPIEKKLKELTESIGKPNFVIFGIQRDDGNVTTSFSMTNMKANVVLKAVIRVLDMIVSKTIK
jgi:hypothetical protein